MLKPFGMKPLGGGYRIINTSDQYMHDKENKKIIEEILTKARSIRGEIISSSMDIDFYLGHMISTFFFGAGKIGDGGNPTQDDFEELILYTDFFSNRKKMDVLNLLIERYPNKFPMDSKEKKQRFMNEVENIIAVRNSIAHGELIIDFTKRTATIFHLSGSKRKKPIVLSQDFLEKFQKQILEITDFYIRLYRNLVVQISNDKTTGGRYHICSSDTTN